VNDMLERIETKYKYLVYKPGNSSGLIYNSSTERNPTKAKVDSFFKSNTATDFEKFYLKKSKNDSLVETYQDKSAGYFQEKYIPKKRPDPSFSDTTYLSYSSSIGEIDFSFSREMDKKMAKKLVQIRIIYLSKRHGQNIMPVVERELLFKLEKIGLSEEEFFSIRKIIDMAEFDLLQKK
jgi:hypothetical protein